MDLPKFHFFSTQNINRKIDKFFGNVCTSSSLLEVKINQPFSGTRICIERPQLREHNVFSCISIFISFAFSSFLFDGTFVCISMGLPIWDKSIYPCSCGKWKVEATSPLPAPYIIRWGHRTLDTESRQDMKFGEKMKVAFLKKF